MTHQSSRPLTQALAQYVATLAPGDIPSAVRERTVEMVLDGSGALLAAADPRLSTGRRIAAFARAQGGAEQATVVGHGFRTGAALAALANGTMGYACDVEPHHPAGVLHPIAVMVPTALAISELAGAGGERLMTAIVLGCEIEYRLSMALGPVEQYNLGFHPSAVCGCFGATAAASFLLGLGTEQLERAFGLAGCQASGLMAWETDPSENSRPFQMGMAARNGVTAALLARDGFGAPDRIFDGGHDVLSAYSRVADPAPLTADLGSAWDGVTELAIKPYPCVSFLHPALDALETLLARHALSSSDIASIQLRFADAGAHCVDDNPLKGHNAQYVLPVRTALGRLSYLDLFEDRRLSHPEVRRLAESTSVVRDFGEFEQKFPDFYIGEITLDLHGGRRVSERCDIARGYPEAPLPQADIESKFHEIVGEVADEQRRAALATAATTIFDADSVDDLAALLAARPRTSVKGE